jgi:hypothetical protein
MKPETVEDRVAHTPGPWTIQRRSPAAVRWDSIIRGSNGEPVASSLAAGYPERESEANARLIAAAPDLLKALKTAIRIANEARIEWDRAPGGMKAGKLLISLSDPTLNYRADITEMHAALTKASVR